MKNMEKTSGIRKSTWWAILLCVYALAWLIVTIGFIDSLVSGTREVPIYLFFITQLPMIYVLRRIPGMFRDRERDTFIKSERKLKDDQSGLTDSDQG
jgi:hypothetical protein